MLCRPFFITFITALVSINANAVVGNFSLGYGSGGTPLSEVTGGQGYDIRAAEGLFLMGGVLLPISPTIPHHYELQLDIGYMFQTDGKEKNDVTWTRLPIEAIYFYRNTRELYRFGWGLTYHFANKISAKGNNAGADASVDNATGWVVAVEKLMNVGPQKENTIGLGLKYVSIDYKSSSFSKDATGDCLYFTYSAIIEDSSARPTSDQKSDSW